MSSSLLLGHMNTILFAMATLAACTAVLFAILTPGLSDYFVFLTTVAIMLSIIVISTLWTLVTFETTDKKPSSSNIATVKVCPDYYSYSSNVSGEMICKSENILYNSATDSYVKYKLIECIDGGKAKKVISEINLDTFVKNVSDKAICAIVNGTNPDLPETFYTPWTRVRPYCGGDPSMPNL